MAEYVFCTPGTSAPVERVFSLMNNVWTDDRGLMKESTTPGSSDGRTPQPPPFFVPVELSENLASLLNWKREEQNF
ncbi:hypothetical protein J6590_046754 [Homalodisca vitripennis]|nr:hypothetical protein J6590_046754 [Homalodisca vitripennis]